MTLLLVFRATDGLLLLADGRRTKTPAGTLDNVPMDDTAKKSAITPAGNAVAMAAGSTRITDNRYAADVFEDAMGAFGSDALPVESVARACFDELQPWNDQFLEEQRAVWVVVAGYDPGSTDQVIYRFTIPDSSAGPQLTDEVRRDGVLAIPLDRDEDVGHLVREKFGHIPPEKYLELIDLEDGDPRLAGVADEGYTLEDQPLEVVAAEVTRVLPELLDTRKATFHAQGVGGNWTMYKLRPGQPANTDPFKWGPHGVKD